MDMYQMLEYMISQANDYKCLCLRKDGAVFQQGRLLHFKKLDANTYEVSDGHQTEIVDALLVDYTSFCNHSKYVQEMTS